MCVLLLQNQPLPLEYRATYPALLQTLMLVNALPKDGVEDMTCLNFLHEPALLDNLRQRFERNHVYTNTCRICIAVNPFNWQVSQPLYSDELRRSYRGRELAELPPHVYAAAEEAYRQLSDSVDGDRNDGATDAASCGARGSRAASQSILVSGESGAGKTESVKIVMSYLAHCSRDRLAGRVVDTRAEVSARVLASNPLLESFGNAKTLRNNNSSRFGKFIQLRFSADCEMNGARIQVYLLEKSRVVRQVTSERNYHVLYQLLAGRTVEQRALWQLDAPADSYAILAQSGCTVIDGLDDALEYRRTAEAMEAVGLGGAGGAEQESVWRALAAVLLLPQLGFESTSQHESGVESASVPASFEPLLEHLGELLGISSAASSATEELRCAICTRRLITRDDEVTVPLTLTQALDARHALTKAIYGRLFSWLVERCNATLEGGGGERSRGFVGFVGVLDIFGFEDFAHNSLEQLCINYANEALQQQFNCDVFKAQQAEYEAEGI